MLSRQAGPLRRHAIAVCTVARRAGRGFGLPRFGRTLRKTLVADDQNKRDAC